MGRRSLTRGYPIARAWIGVPHQSDSTGIGDHRAAKSRCPQSRSRLALLGCSASGLYSAVVPPVLQFGPAPLPFQPMSDDIAVRPTARENLHSSAQSRVPAALER